MEFTKGEWKVANSGGSVIKGGVGHPMTIAVLETVPLKITPEIEANAQLIAAAPDLLKACLRAVEPLEEGEDCGLTTKTYNFVCAACRKAGY